MEECDRTLASDKEEIEKIITQINKNNADIDIIQIEIKDSQKRIAELERDLELVRKKIESLKK